MLPARRVPAVGLCLLMLALAALGTAAPAPAAAAPAHRALSTRAHAKRPSTVKPSVRVPKACIRAEKGHRSAKPCVAKPKRGASAPASRHAVTPAKHRSSADPAAGEEESATGSSAGEAASTGEPATVAEEAAAIAAEEIPLEEIPPGE